MSPGGLYGEVCHAGLEVAPGGGADGMRRQVMVTPRHLEWWTDLPTHVRFLLSLLSGDWWLTKFGQWVCERKGHPGVVWFNPNALEPDMHCDRCGKDIG